MRRFFLLFFIVFLLFGCDRYVQVPDGKLNVVTTTGMVADMVKRIGGEAVHVTALMGAGVDPHLYKASEGDVIRMAHADVIFYSGLHLEGRLTEVFERMGGMIPTVAIADSLPLDRLISVDEAGKMHDPHVWFDVDLWTMTARAVTDTLVKLDPNNIVRYQRNEEDVIRHFAELQEYVQAQASRLPRENRVLVTAHDAFSYFGKAYGFDVMGLQGVSTAAEAATSDVQELAKMIVARQVPAVFVETSIPERTIEALQAAVRSRGFEVRIGGHLYSDALGTPGTPEGDYPGMVRHNINTIVSALMTQEMLDAEEKARQEEAEKARLAEEQRKAEEEKKAKRKKK